MGHRSFKEGAGKRQTNQPSASVILYESICKNLHATFFEPTPSVIPSVSEFALGATGRNISLWFWEKRRDCGQRRRAKSLGIREIDRESREQR
jgi:hypothetical protein